MYPLLEVHHLRKQFRTQTVIDNISFAIPKGRVVGFLGPNGAGKTTTIHMLLGITTPSGGNISYFGKQLQTHKSEILKKINTSSAFNTLQGRISVYENLLVFAHLYEAAHPKQTVLQIADELEINHLLPQVYNELSAGQKTRVNFAKALINNPEMILLDEPTASLDPDIADKLLTTIETLHKTRDLTILYTSHNMDEVARICDEVIFLHEGKIVAQDAPHRLKTHNAHATLIVEVTEAKATLIRFLQMHAYEFSFINEQRLAVRVQEALITRLIRDIHQAHIVLESIDIKRPTLEDFFLEIARTHH